MEHRRFRLVERVKEEEVMIDYQRSGNGIYEVSVSGRLTRPEIDLVWGRMKADMPASGKVKVLEVIHDFDGIDFDAMLEDLRVGLPMADRVSHIAIVTDRKWITALTRLAGVLMSAETRTYTLDQIAEARAWLDGA
jgi:hypothetical protein